MSVTYAIKTHEKVVTQKVHREIYFLEVYIFPGGPTTLYESLELYSDIVSTEPRRTDCVLVPYYLPAPSTPFANKLLKEQVIEMCK